MSPRSRWRWLARTGGVLVAAVFLAGVLTSAFHSHADSKTEQNCVVCALAHSAADTPTIVAVPIASIVVLRIEPATATAAPACAPRRRSASRAPPLS